MRRHAEFAIDVLHTALLKDGFKGFAQVVLTGLQVHTTANECQWRSRIACSCDLAIASQVSLLSKLAATVEEPE